MTELFVNTVYQNGKTIISDCHFTSPCKIAKPFYREDGFTEIMIMCASPGILSGDKYDMRFIMGPHTKTIISEQSYRKLYNTGDARSEQNIRVQVGENAVLYFVPYPVIPFAGSRFYSRTEIELQVSSKLIFGDIYTCGRHGMGEDFEFNELNLRINIKIDNKLVFLDNCRLKKEYLSLKTTDTLAINDIKTSSISEEAESLGTDFSGIGFFEGYTCQGVFFLYGFDDAVSKLILPETENTAAHKIEGAVSKSLAGYTIRLFGNSADSLHKYASKMFIDLLKKI